MPLYLVMVLVAFAVFMLVLAVVSTRDIFEGKGIFSHLDALLKK